MLVWAACAPLVAFGQSQSPDRKILSLSSTLGERQASFAAAYTYKWYFGSQKRFSLGTGARLTSMFGKKVDYVTAGPARLTRGTDIPFAVVVSSQNEANQDTLVIQRPFVTALNVLFDIGYRFNNKWSAGGNIDLIGATVGRTTSGINTADIGGGILQSTTDPKTKPTAFNLLLTGDNDLGTLNSEFFVGYRVSKKWELRAVYQFLFTEYRTSDFKQIALDGTEIQRFRNKANNFGLAVAYQF